MIAKTSAKQSVLMAAMIEMLSQAVARGDRVDWFSYAQFARADWSKGAPLKLAETFTQQTR
jgi:hypothetical protein